MKTYDFAEHGLPMQPGEPSWASEKSGGGPHTQDIGTIHPAVQEHSRSAGPNDAQPQGVVEDAGVLRDPGMTDSEHARRVASLAQYPSMQARIMEAGGIVIPPTVVSKDLN